MDVFIAGGDRRNAHLVRLLRAGGLDARAAGLEKCALEGVSHAPLAAAADADWVLLNSPVKCELAERPFGLGELFSHLRPGTRLVFLGPGAPPVDSGDFRTFDLMADEAFLRRNAILTAEGALFAAMRAQEKALRDCDCLVIGWGRIGRALTEMLVALGVRATVASRAERSRRQAQERGAQAVETAAPFRGAERQAAHLFHAALPGLEGSGTGARQPGAPALSDLSSPPYAVDVEAAHRLGLRAWREPGLPGRYCPESAALAIAAAFEKLRKGGKRRCLT